MSYIDMSKQQLFHVCVYAQVLERGACATFPSSTILLHLNRLVRFHGHITFHANMHPCLACESTGVPAETARERITPCVGDTGAALRACSAPATRIADYFIFPGRSANNESDLREDVVEMLEAQSNQLFNTFNEGRTTKRNESREETHEE